MRGWGWVRPHKFLHVCFSGRGGINTRQSYYFAPDLSCFAKNLAPKKFLQHLCAVAFEALCSCRLLNVKQAPRNLHCTCKIIHRPFKSFVRDELRRRPAVPRIDWRSLLQWLKGIATVSVKSKATRNKAPKVCLLLPVAILAITFNLQP